LDKRVDGLDFLRGLLGPRCIAYKKGAEAKERRSILHELFTQQNLNALMPSFCETIMQSGVLTSQLPFLHVEVGELLGCYRYYDTCPPCHHSSLRCTILTFHLYDHHHHHHHHHHLFPFFLVASWANHPEVFEAQAKARRLCMDLNVLNVFGTSQDTVELCEKFSDALQLLLEARFASSLVPLSKRWWRLRTALRQIHACEYH